MVVPTHAPEGASSSPTLKSLAAVAIWSAGSRASAETWRDAARILAEKKTEEAVVKGLCR